MCTHSLTQSLILTHSLCCRAGTLAHVDIERERERERAQRENGIIPTLASPQDLLKKQKNLEKNEERGGKKKLSFFSFPHFP